MTLAGAMAEALGNSPRLPLQISIFSMHQRQLPPHISIFSMHQRQWLLHTILSLLPAFKLTSLKHHCLGLLMRCTGQQLQVSHLHVQQTLLRKLLVVSMCAWEYRCAWQSHTWDCCSLTRSMHHYMVSC